MLMNDLENVLFTEEQIREKVKELADAISNDYRNRDLVLVGVLKGGVIFLSDLCRMIPIPHSFDMVAASSYGSETSSSGHVIITKDVELPLKGKDVLLIEDIYDTGNTLRVVKELIEVHSPRSLEICSLLWKEKSSRTDIIPIKYVGFRVPDVFVVGYGLDFNEKYRNLACIGVLKKELYK